MKLRDADSWKQWVNANADDPYGAACVRYAEAWADEMEKRMAAGEKLEDIASTASHDVDRRPGFGITGFMYGCAVQMLAQCWEHGEALRRWHNIDTQIHDEGEKANESGGVLNPAVTQGPAMTKTRLEVEIYATFNNQPSSPSVCPKCGEGLSHAFDEPPEREPDWEPEEEV